MSPELIDKLTPEQEALIPHYREKWRAIACKTEPIDRKKVAEAVKAAYAALRKQEPDILYCDSPFAALELIVQSQSGSRLERQLGNQVGSRLRSQLDIPLWSQLRSQLDSQLASQLETQLLSLLMLKLMSQLGRQLERQLNNQLREQLVKQKKAPVFFCGGYPISWLQVLGSTNKWWNKYIHYFDPEGWACRGSLFDFCISVLNCDYDQRKWEEFQLLASECGWVFPYEKTCLVCERPIKLSFDSENRLHAEGEPAIQFADGFSMYANHGEGVWLPKKYGKLHPREWQAQWLLEDKNAEVRRVLIQEIGYARILQELQATELDTWQEYTLVKILRRIDIEKIHLLKMTCPSTGFVHVLRVPPNIQSAHDAIGWVNWGVDPEEFSVQT